MWQGHVTTVALAQVLKDVPIVYLYNPINRYGVAAGVAGLRAPPDGMLISLRGL